MKSNGTQVTRVTNSPAFEVNPALSYDNSAIAFVKGDVEGPNIYVMSFDGLNPVQLTDDPHKDLYPSWAADGSEITFCSDRDGNCEIYLMDAIELHYINIGSIDIPSDKRNRRIVIRQGRVCLKGWIVG